MRSTVIGLLRRGSQVRILPGLSPVRRREELREPPSDLLPQDNAGLFLGISPDVLQKLKLHHELVLCGLVYPTGYRRIAVCDGLPER